MSELEIALKGLVGAIMEDTKRENIDGLSKAMSEVPTETQKDALRKHIDGGKFSVGDAVKRNSIGLENYRYPVDGQVAVVSAVFDKPVLDENEDIATGEITVAFLKRPRSYLVDLRFYEKAE